MRFEAVQLYDRALQQFFLTTQILRAFGVVPNVRVFQLRVDYDQTVCFFSVVKDTPIALRCALEVRIADWIGRLCVQFP